MLDMLIYLAYLEALEASKALTQDADCSTIGGD